MSDLYLVLRHRVSEVKQWASLGTEVMRDARQARGWSYETVARKIPVSSKTYERYEKAGQVPVELVDKIAGILGLEIERPEFRRVVSLPAEGPGGDLRRKLDQIDELVRDVRTLLEEREPEAPPAPRQASR